MTTVAVGPVHRLFLTSAVHQARSADELYSMLMRVNEELKAKPSGDWAERVQGKALEKARDHGLFLGLNDYAWVDML